METFDAHIFKVTGKSISHDFAIVKACSSTLDPCILEFQSLSSWNLNQSSISNDVGDHIKHAPCAMRWPASDIRPVGPGLRLVRSSDVKSSFSF